MLEVSSVGYKTVRRNVTLKKGRTLEEDFEIEEDAVALDGVVVSANRNETTRRLAPTLVNVVDLKIFENTNSTTLAQGLSFQPGVRVESNCQNWWFPASAYQWTGWSLYANPARFRPILVRAFRCVWYRADPCQHDRTCGSDAWRWVRHCLAHLLLPVQSISSPKNRCATPVCYLIRLRNWRWRRFRQQYGIECVFVTDDQRAGLYIFGQNRHRSAYDHDGDGYSEIPKLVLVRQLVSVRS